MTYSQLSYFKQAVLWLGLFTVVWLAIGMVITLFMAPVDKDEIARFRESCAMNESSFTRQEGWRQVQEVDRQRLAHLSTLGKIEMQEFPAALICQRFGSDDSVVFDEKKSLWYYRYRKSTLAKRNVPRQL